MISRTAGYRFVLKNNVKRPFNWEMVIDVATMSLAGASVIILAYINLAVLPVLNSIL